MLRILRTALIIAVLDGAFAIATVWSRLGTAAPARVMKAVASGVLGKAAATGGSGTVLLGMLCHFTVALGWTIGYALIARRLPFVQRLVQTNRGTWIAAGIYGACMWLGMCYVVIPLSQATAIPPDNWRFWANFVWHIVGLGPIIVFLTEQRSPRAAAAATGSTQFPIGAVERR